MHVILWGKTPRNKSELSTKHFKWLSALKWCMWDVCCANSCCLISQNGNTCSQENLAMVCDHSEKNPWKTLFPSDVSGYKILSFHPVCTFLDIMHVAIPSTTVAFPFVIHNMTLKLTIYSPKRGQYLGIGYLARMCRDSPCHAITEKTAKSSQIEKFTYLLCNYAIATC